MKKTLQVIRGDVWNNPEVVAAANAADARVFCVAYVTQACDEMFQSGDVLVCDASRKAVSCGETDPRFLLRLLKRGVSVYSLEALHAKCAVFGDFVLLGSANMSESSALRLVELSVLQRNSRLATEVLAFILGLSKKAAKLAVEDLKRLRSFWHTKQSPWQNNLPKRKTTRPARGLLNHVVTVRPAPDNPRAVSLDELDESTQKAEKLLEEEALGKSGNLCWYYTSEAWSKRQPKKGDEIIVVRNSSKGKNARATVSGPGTVVMVEKKRKVHIVHYLIPDREIAYGKFRAEFNGRKRMNRHGVPEDVFESMAKFIKRGGK